MGSPLGSLIAREKTLLSSHIRGHRAAFAFAVCLRAFRDTLAQARHPVRLHIYIRAPRRVDSWSSACVQAERSAALLTVVHSPGGQCCRTFGFVPCVCACVRALACLTLLGAAGAEAAEAPAASQHCAVCRRWACAWSVQDVCMSTYHHAASTFAFVCAHEAEDSMRLCFSIPPHTSGFRTVPASPS